MIEFITPALRNYRLELFERLNREYAVRFVFTGQQETKKFGGLNIPESWNFENIDVLHGKSLRNYKALARALLRDKYELIFSSPAESMYNLLVMAVCRLRHKKVIFWGEYWYWPHKTIILKLYFFVIKRMLEHCDAIIATGEKPYALYTSTLKRKNGIFCAPKYVVPYRRRDAARLIENLALKDRKILGKRVILFMGRIAEIKGVDFLIRAFKLLENKFDDVYLLIVGTGPFEEFCRRLAKELRVTNVMFVGYISETDSDLIELYHNVCSVFVLPSVFLNDSPEANGYAVYESMSVGKPIVVTDAVGAAPEFVRNGINGLVVKNRTVSDLFEALSRILEDEEMQERMSLKSREIFEEKMSLERQFKAFKDAVEFVQGTRTS